MTIQKPLTAAVIGCGSIGALKPDKFDSPFGENILTHAHAFRVNPDVELVGVVDSDPARAKVAGEKWGCRHNTDYVEALLDWRPDIVSVCVPTEYHLEVLLAIIRIPNYRPRLVIAEKPFCSRIGFALNVSHHYRQMGVPILVNYSRRFSADYQILQERFAKGEFGEIYHARLLYGRGLNRDGCHGIDAFNWFLLGNPLDVRCLGGRVDYLPEDPTMDLVMVYDKCGNVQMVGTNSKAYGIFEMEFVAEKGRVVLSENGAWFHTYIPQQERVYGSYRSMPGRPADIRKTDLTNMLSRMVANAAGHLLRREPLLCTDLDALNVHEVIRQANQLFAKENR